VVVAATIPMGIIQASSTMTDTVVALWVACAAAEALALWSGGMAAQPGFFASLAAGLALLTKPTAAAFVLPVGSSWRDPIPKGQPVQVPEWGLAAVVLVSAVNAGHWIRNMDLYGNPVSGAGRIAEHANHRMTPAGASPTCCATPPCTPGHPGTAGAADLRGDCTDPRLDRDRPKRPGTTSVGPFKPVLATTNEHAPATWCMRC